MLKRIYIAGILTILLGPGLAFSAADEPEANDDAIEHQTSEERFLKLGTNKGILDGTNQKDLERNLIKSQIKTFIPPLLRPAFVGHAYVLPPKTFAVSLSQRFARIDGGDDFFMNGKKNTAIFADADIRRQLTDLDLFYGFDFGKKYLHSFTVRLNVPYRNSSVDGFIHPHGQQFIAIENAGSSAEIGDISLLVKKKLFDQGNSPIGLAIAAGVTLPTGANDETFGSDGRVTTRRPQPPNTTVAQGFDALMMQMVQSGMWGAPQCFFHNFNQANRALCGGGAFGVPAFMAQSFAPGGMNENNQFVGDFPFNNGVFGRFSNDGRLPSALQPGTGETGSFLGLFLTRQFQPGSLVGRSALHAGVTHNFVQASDGIDAGDTTTYFMSFVKPVYGDYLAVDLTYVVFDHDDDSYAGKMPVPTIHSCGASDLGVVGGCMAAGNKSFVFELKDRPSFSGGVTGMLAGSLIYSPDPQIRITFSGLFRVQEPDLGPAPGYVIRAGIDFNF